VTVYNPTGSTGTYLDDSFKYRVPSGLIGYYANDQICWGTAIAYNASKTSKTYTLCENTDFLAAYYMSSSVYPYSGAIGLSQSNPLFGTHFLLNTKQWSAAQYSYLAAIYWANYTVLTLGGTNASYIAATDNFTTYNT